jgi:hypothetical protein
MKVVGQMAVSNFDRLDITLSNLYNQCDEIYIRFDKNIGSDLDFDKIKKYCGDKLKNVLFSNTVWNKSNWREEMIRMLDDVKPDIVISLDQDEAFEVNIKDELNLFYKSKSDVGMFAYYMPMPTEENLTILKGKSYPLHRHCKVFKWKENITFKPYVGYAIPTNYYNKNSYYNFKTKILHYCFYSKKYRIEKAKRIYKYYPKDLERYYGIKYEDIENYFGE